MKTSDYKMFGAVALHIQAASAKHPNVMKFSGVLVRIDEPSTKAPHGSDGHKILIPRSLAAAQLHTLKGMPVNYHDKLDQHNQSRPVGVIKAAKIVGNDIIISGVIWKKNFPNAPKDLSSSKLGMSFEAADISVADKHADVWTLSGMCFTGATILYKDAAAYFKTSAKALAAAASNQQKPLLTLVANSQRKGATMATKAEKMKAKAKLKGKKSTKASTGAPMEDEEAAAVTASAIATAIQAAMEPTNTLLKGLKKTVATLAASIEASQEEEDDDEEVEASEDDDDEEEEVAAAKGKKKPAAKDDEDDEEDDDAMDSEADDEDDLEDMDESDDDDPDTNPGSINKDANTNKGRKVKMKPAGKKNNKITASADADAVARLTAQNKKLRKLVNTQSAAISAAAEKTDRRSISASAVMASTLAKGSLDVATLHAEGQKVSVADMDTLCAAAGIVGPQSIALKNEATRLGILEE